MPNVYHIILIRKFVLLLCLWMVPQVLWCGGNDALRLLSMSSNDNNALPPLKITFITGNEMKAAEMNLILEKHGATKSRDEDQVPLVHLRVVKVDLPEIQEIDTRAIAKNKAIQGAQLAGGPCVVEDTSLMFHALGGVSFVPSK